jgi:hypothetical protein
MKLLHLGIASLLLGPALVPASHAADACALLKPAEIGAALGGKAGAFAPSAAAPGASFCRGQVGKFSVLVRIGTRKPGDTGEKEKKGIEMVRRMGAQVEVKTEGDLTCSKLSSPPQLAELGNSVTCTVIKAGNVVGVEVSAAAAADLPAIGPVRSLANTAASRL